MTRGVNKEAVNEEQNNNRKYELAGIVLIAVAVFMVVAYCGFSTGTFGTFVNKVLRYSLGLGALFAPLVFFVLGCGLTFAHRNLVRTLGFVAAVIFILSALGILHHIFIPFGEELAPDQLPLGGGLVGGLVINGLRKVLGSVGALVVLIACMVVSVVLTGKVSLRSSAEKAGDSFKKITSHKIFSSDYEEDEQPEEAEEPRTVTPAPRDSSTSPVDVYADSEFSDYTEGIKKQGVFKKILNFGHDKAEEPETSGNDYSDVNQQFPNADKMPLTSVYKERPEIVVLRPKITEEPNTEIPETPVSVQTPAAEPTINNFTDTEEESAGEDGNDAGKVNASTEDAAPAQVKTKRSHRYKLPPLSLLNTPVKSRSKDYEADIKKQCQILEQTLADFRVDARVIHVTRGPSVTRFELEPAPGVKVSSVVNLADDIALRLAASGVRIEAPIPGKAAIGIEAPNIKTEPVSFKEVVDCKELKNNHDKLCIGLGRDIAGNVITADLTKMPHLLVAGSTGSGKSVCINTIIAGILYKARPDEVKFILVDPKVVELTNYNDIPHLLVPVVTDAKKAASALHWGVMEMERRYKAFADNHVRDIDSYNLHAVEKMPYIVIIIDELSDLMMVAKVDVEDAILRLAQKARAAGIHLVLATQRPSVDVITGIVKANIPSRIAFAVSSQIDSRTILDETGAEKLLGKGDMLYYPIGKNKPVRVQGAFVTDDELNRIVHFIKEQEVPVEYSEDVTQQALSSDKAEASAQGKDDLTGDELFGDALRLVLDVGQASSSMLQRRFRIGYTRAARLVDCMEQLGIVGPAVGSKPRQLLMSRADIEAKFLNKQ